MTRIIALAFLLAPSIGFCTDPLSGPVPSTAPPAGTPSYIWVTDSLVKVRQDQGSAQTSQGIAVYCTQNEICSFQLHATIPTGGIPSLNVTFSSLTQSGGSFVIGSTATDIIVYREAYLSVTTKTATQATFYNSTGTYPDILIPAVDPQWGQTSTAFPFNAQAGKNQSAWVDVHIPTNAPSGYYQGTLTVSSASTVLANLAIVYVVWQWPGGFMPSTATLQTIIPIGFAGLCIQQFGGPTETNCGSYTNASSADNAAGLVALDAAIQGLYNRVSIVTPYPPINSNFSSFETVWEPVIKGTQTRSPQILPGAKLTSVEAQYLNYGTSSASNWMTEATNRGWVGPLLPYDYTADEPNPPGFGPTWTQLIASATLMHAASPQMPVQVTTSLQDMNAQGAQTYIDLLTPIIDEVDVIGGPFKRAGYDVWAATHTGVTARIGTYLDCVETGTCTNGVVGNDATKTWPNRDIDGLPVPNRLMEWLAFARNRASYELYFTATYCWTAANSGANACGYPSTPSNNPWNTVYYSGGHGDGTIVYPGMSSSPFVTAGDNRVIFSVLGSTPVFLPSIRLKHMRDGIQDVEYMNTLTNYGLSATVATATSTFITNSYTFNVSTYTTGAWTGNLQAARTTMGNALHQITYPQVSVPPLCPQGKVCIQWR